MRLFFTLLLFSLLNTLTIAQYVPGARQISMANSDVALSNDVFSLFSNPAGLSQFNWREIGIYYSPAPFGLTELSNGYIAYNEPFNFGSLSLGGMTYGFELYRESKIVLGCSYNYDNILFTGISATYHNFSIQSYGSSGTFYLNVGGLVYILDELRWGFSIDNLNKATVAEIDDQIPMVFVTGLSFDLINNLSLNLALEKDIRFNPSVKFGIEYDIIEYLSLRTGTSNEPSRFTAGVGINYSLFSLDYAFFTHQDLGLTHQAGIIISFGREGSRSSAVRKHLNSR